MKLKLVIAAFALSSAGMANAALVNGNFETGTLSGWTATGNTAIAHLSGGFYFGAGGASLGNSAIGFNGGDQPANGTLSQTFATVVGQNYRVTYEYGATVGGTQSLLAAILGTGVSQTATDSNPGAALTSFSFDFVANSVNSTLRFSDVASNLTTSLDGVLDNVSVRAVPEPGSLALLALGLTGLAGWRRKQAK